MKVITVCGAGLGTSLILRMYVEEVFDKLGIPVEIEATDVSFARGSNADLIVTSSELVSVLIDSGIPVIGIRNLIDRQEIERKLRHHLGESDADGGSDD